MAKNLLPPTKPIFRKLGLEPLTPAYAGVAFAIMERVFGKLIAYGNSLGQLIVPGGMSVTGNISQSAGSFGVVQPQTTIAADGAITIASGSVFLTKGSAAAITLAAPTSGAPGTGLDGTRISVISGSSFAHVITATSLIEDGTTGVPHTTATFAAFKGASITLEAKGGLWYVVANNAVTIS